LIYMPFDWINVNNASEVLDYSGYGNEGAAINFTSTTGKYGKGYLFNPNLATKITIPNTAALNTTDDFSISAWANGPLDTNCNGECYLFMKGLGAASTGASYGLLLYQTVATFWVMNTSNKAPLVSKTITYTGGFRMIVGTFDNSTHNASLYVDGVFVASNILAGNFQANTVPIYIGFRPTWNYYYNGTIDEVKVYNKVLSAAEIAAEYAQTSVTDYTNTGVQLGTNWTYLSTGRIDGNIDELWMWADYDCNPGNWSFWEPQIDFRGCCEGCDACDGD